MLYAYAFDHDHRVKGVINTVGPADLTDPSLTNNLILMGVVGGFLGKAIYDYQGNKALFEETSPARRVTPKAPPTLSFYGDKDPLIPVTQMPKLRTALENNHVWHYDTSIQVEATASGHPMHRPRITSPELLLLSTSFSSKP